jgi:nucleoside-diphosphate-sugar epimerase
MPERFLVTGAYGCIGTWTVRQLVREGVEVIGVDAGDDDHRVRELLDAVEVAAARFVKADVSDPAQVADVFALDPTHVIHLAALQVPGCREDPVLGARVNVVGTAALFAAALAHGLSSPIVYASSVAAFAAADGEGHVPTDPSGQPETHYGVFKIANEGTARVFALENSLASIGLRPSVVYGACRDTGLTSATTAAMRAAAHGSNYTIPFGGSCEFQFAPDAAAAFIAAARAPFTGAAVVNIPGTTLAIEEVVAEIERVVPESAGRIGFEGPPLPFPEALDSSRFRSIVGTVGVTPFGQGVAETVGHFRRSVNRVTRDGRRAQSLVACGGRDTAAASDSSKGPPWPL